VDGQGAEEYLLQQFYGKMELIIKIIGTGMVLIGGYYAIKLLTAIYGS